MAAKALFKALASLRLAIACLVLLMALVAACTLAQARMGIHPAVEMYIRSWVVSWRGIPLAPGGAAAGLALLANLLAAQWTRLELSWRRGGLWLVHLGLVLLFVGEFAAGILQEESQMTLVQGRPQNFSQSLRQVELALVDATDPARDKVYAVAESALRRGTVFEDSRIPFSIGVRNWARRPSSEASEGEAEEVTADVELSKGGSPLGSWSLSSFQSDPRPFAFEGRAFSISLRPRRIYQPFTLTLERFVREFYPGTDIPKGFSSSVRLKDPRSSENRAAVISMNNPLRYGGRSFYQASYVDDSISILQVVSNPGRLLPYISCVLVSAGLLLHFLLRLRPWRREPA